VRLWSNALLFREQKAQVESILDAVRTHNLLSQDEFEALLRSNARADLCGDDPRSGSSGKLGTRLPGYERVQVGESDKSRTD
jgi:hypothetical protein